jgi:oligoendopeptidase F
MKSENAHLRTRIASNGMDYKGYNIAIHEFGHNVEQTITLNDIDYYILSGVPNTAFTEAMAFVFQKRDLEVLGIKEDNPDKMALMALDNFWSAYEIMGVSLVDMAVWKWLYAHPNATAEDLKKQTLVIAKDVWNKYFADVLGGEKDQVLLGIYSHMIENPLYLSAYPIGHLVEFQVERYIQGKDFAEELHRMLVQGRLTPQVWMKGAVGSPLSIEPTINATEEALKTIK